MAPGEDSGQSGPGRSPPSGDQRPLALDTGAEWGLRAECTPPKHGLGWGCSQDISWGPTLEATVHGSREFKAHSQSTIRSMRSHTTHRVKGGGENRRHAALSGRTGAWEMLRETAL